MKRYFKGRHNWIIKLISTCILMCLLVMSRNSFSIGEDNIITLNVSNIQYNPPAHEHIWHYRYDKTYHWEECSICMATQNRTAHTLSGNGGSKTNCENGYYNNSYRDVCSICGFQSGPQIIIHGRLENYADCHRLNYGSMSGTYLEDIKQITKSEFNSISYPETSGGQSYTWSDPDGDGYGWVFMGGPIMGDSYGVKGTVELIVGSEGDYGRKAAFDEYYALTDYINSDTTPTKSEFVTYLNTKINSSSSPTRHLLYGYNTKYSSKVTNAQFNKLVAEFKGYTPHVSGWGWSSMAILHSGHQNHGQYIYTNSNCYDSSNNHNVSFTDGIKTKCDLCGASYTGNESYENRTWYVCKAGASMKNGETLTCSGHTLTGKGGITLGTVYCTYRKVNNVLYVKYRAYPVSGGSVSATGTTNSDNSVTSAEFSLEAIDQSKVTDYTYPWIINMTKSGVTRQLSCGSYYPLIDDTNPTTYGYSGNTTNNSYWGIVGNGSINDISSQATVHVTFKDPQQYSKNTVYATLYDSDKKTVIKQSNGDSKFALTKVSGTSGNNTLWTGTIEINIERTAVEDIYVKATDSTGNQSDFIPIQISYIDSKPPTIEASFDTEEWSKEKILTVTASDSSNSIVMGYSADDMIEVLNTTYNNTRKYKFLGDLYGEKDFFIYAKDASGNLISKIVKVKKLDNTIPTITNINKVLNTNGNLTNMTISVEANDINNTLNTEGSGVDKYIIKTQNTSPTENDLEWQDDSSFTVNDNREYYIWTKDKVGNISQMSSTTVSELTAPYTVKHYLMDSDGENYTLANTETFIDLTNSEVTARVRNYEGYTAPEEQKVTILSDGSAEVSYYYKKNASVTVNYIDINTNGQVEETVTINGYVGKEYSTEPKSIENYTYLRSEGIVSGQMPDGGANVTYYYAKNTSVLVKYVDKATGQELEESKIVNGYVSKDYSVNPLSIAEYEVSENSGNTSGKMIDEQIVVIFYYKKYTGILVKYVDINTNEEISETKSYDGLSMDNYDVSADKKEINGYTFICDSGNTIGTMKNSCEEIIFYYAYNTKVIINHIDAGNNQILQKEEIDGYEGKQYVTNRKEIEGYTFKNSTQNTSGNMPREVMEVNYYYSKNSKLRVKYINYTTNERIIDMKEINGVENEDYDVSDYKKEIDGYEYLKSTGNEVGKIERDGTTVIFYYLKKVKITVKYIDINTKKEIYKEITHTTKAGENYDLKGMLQLEGYVIVGNTDNMKGKAKNDDIVISYYYAKKSKVIVKYQDIDSKKEIAKEEIIDGYDGKEYSTERLDLRDYIYEGSSNNTKGKMKDEDITVYYYYREKTETSIDDTVAKGIIPQTGDNMLITYGISILISGVVGLSIILIRKNKM